ncbi:hypothetical protein M9458_034716, partial [Cirrhinus mrigala]
MLSSKKSDPGSSSSSGGNGGDRAPETLSAPQAGPAGPSGPGSADNQVDLLYRTLLDQEGLIKIQQRDAGP